MKIGFIGTGFMASKHSEVAISLGHEISFALGKRNSRTFDSFLNAHQGCVEFFDLDNFLAQEECDAIIVTTPPFVTQTMLPKLIESKKFVLVEKPGFLTNDLPIKIVSNNRIFFAYNRRFYSSVSHLKRFMQLQSTHLSLTVSEKVAPSIDEKCEILINNSVHYFDLVNYLLPGSNFGNFRISSHGEHIDADILRVSEYLGSISVKFGIPMNSQISATALGKFMLLKPIESCMVANSMMIDEPSDENPIRVYNPVFQKLSLDSNDILFKPGIYLQDETFFKLVLGQISNNDNEHLANLNDAKLALQTAEQFANTLKHNLSL